MSDEISLGVIGGSGLYQIESLSSVKTHEIDTPFGKPSSPIVTGQLAGKQVAFLARHGLGHVLSPSEVNYRANIFALKSLGVRRILSISACGSLREELKPGHIVVPDQLFDFTRGTRKRSFFEDGIVAHIGTADPFCEELSNEVYQALHEVGAIVHKGGTFIAIEGPRFSTRAESNVFRSLGMSIIGMTAAPEAFLAREAEISYAVMAHVTDYDVWHVNEEPVTVEMVVSTLNQNTQTAQKAVEVLLAHLPDEFDCPCQHALETAIITHPEKFNPLTKSRLNLLLGKYFKQ
ncbi:MAG: S-methyl-5'-thioadenosine phosphorylase [Chloroflexi bacterium]|nr:S-methyl-5'-thioadenosine phosphorylase [Chloroflexota bacterium]